MLHMIQKTLRLLWRIVFYGVFRLLLPVFILCLGFSASAHAWFWSSDAQVSMETSANGKPASSSPGPDIAQDTVIEWKHSITNTGQQNLDEAVVAWRIRPAGFIGWFNWFGWLDELKTVCTVQGLKIGERKSCVSRSTAESGQQMLTFSVQGKAGSGAEAKTQRRAYYRGVAAQPSVSLQILAQGSDAASMPGPTVAVGKPVTLSHVVKNTGNMPLHRIRVSNERELPSFQPVEAVCEIQTLNPGESETCETVSNATEGQYKSLGRVQAEAAGAREASAQSPAHYLARQQDLSASPIAIPSSGAAPLTVTFKPFAASSGAVQTYAWDFDGDGTVDRTDPVGNNQTYTYTKPGVYEATVVLTDDRGRQVTGRVTVKVTNAKPVVNRVYAAPSSGAAPLAVRFTADATDRDGIVKYEWDFDGDGNFDSVTTTPAASHSYTRQGSFAAVLRVTDGMGERSTIQVPSIEVSVLPAGSPTLTLKPNTTMGDAPLTVSYTAHLAGAAAGVTAFEWDLDGDGSFEHTTAAASTTTAYRTPGTYYPRVRVKNADGKTAEATTQVRALAKVQLSLSADKLNALQKESVTVNTVINGDMKAGILIEDTAGTLVRTLVPVTQRPAGSYQDSWDGKDNTGKYVSDGEYRAILLYQVDGATRRHDLALTTGGKTYNPARTNIHSTFNPFTAPVVTTVTLPKSSEVTAFVGFKGLDQRFVTLVQRHPIGSGKHTFVWHGEDGKGVIKPLPPGEEFLFGVFAYEVPDNGIVVRSGVHPMDVRLDPVYYIPMGMTGPNNAHIVLALDRPGAAEIAINDAQYGGEVLRFKRENLVAGKNSIQWDGKDSRGKRLPAGIYRITAVGIDANGKTSLPRHAMFRIYY